MKAMFVEMNWIMISTWIILLDKSCIILWTQEFQDN